jgi:sugar/nucleoside kinase (ribokinase family)
MNAIRTLASLGRKTAFTGMVGADEFGLRIATRMEQLGILSHIASAKQEHAADGEGTGSCVILITPDGERTMNTNLGVSSRYSKSDIPFETIKNAKVMHFTGYQWDTPRQKEAIMAAIAAGKDHGTLISFDLADPFVVERHREELQQIVKGEADIVFANKEEAKLLYNNTPAYAAEQIAATGAIAVIKLGAEGAMVRSGQETIQVAPVATKVVDTTAAGDMFAAGFLNGFSLGKDLGICGQMAATLASDVISRIGATVSHHAIGSVNKL